MSNTANKRHGYLGRAAFRDLLAFWMRDLAFLIGRLFLVLSDIGTGKRTNERPGAEQKGNIR